MFEKYVISQILVFLFILLNFDYYRYLWKIINYLIVLEKLYILYFVEIFESFNKEGLIKGIWRNYSYQKSVRLYVCWIIVGGNSLLCYLCNVINYVFDLFRFRCQLQDCVWIIRFMMFRFGMGYYNSLFILVW